MKLSGDELSEILINCELESEDGKHITNIIDFADEYPEVRPLENYKIIVYQEGDHKHDGQMVDYSLTFISPTNEETVIYTEMCLMVDWNLEHDKIFDIK